MMAADYTGKVVLVTGGNSGIGRAAAQLFAAAGAQVVVAARREPEGRQTVEAIEMAGGKAVFIRSDVSLESDVEAMVRRTVETYGRLDCAFNNAGVSTAAGPLHESTNEDWDLVMSANLKGVWLCMKYEIAQMLAQGGGAIVNNSSTAGLAGYARNAIYAASKYGVIGLTTSTAVDYAQTGIRVNAVCPGWTLTPMVESSLERDAEVKAQAMRETPTGRLATPDEVAQAVLWLCSDAASFVTGQALAVDGGLLAQ